MTYSAATGPRASRVRPPRDCAPGSAPVLKRVWMKLHRHSFCAIFGINFSCIYFFLGRLSESMLTGCLIFEFLEIIATNLHSNMCIFASYHLINKQS